MDYCRRHSCSISQATRDCQRAMKISALILTLNEEHNIHRCLDSLSWTDDIVVLDSFSSDRTVEIAKAAGARVFQRHFDTEIQQRSASLRLPFKYPWVFNPDADELTPNDLRDEMLALVANPGINKAFRVRFKNMFMGRWIRYSSLYPTWIMRLFQPQCISFERQVNLRYVVNGSEGRLNNHLLHYSFNKGMEAWLSKHNTYSTGEAMETIAVLNRTLNLKDLFQVDPVARRRALKELSFRLPARYTLRFLYMYLFRRGFLDGAPGYHYCRLLSSYEHIMFLKTRELRDGSSL